MYAQLVQPPCDFQLVVDRERQALALRAVPQCRVVQEHVPPLACFDQGSHKAARPLELLERPRRALSGPTVRQPSASTPPLRKSRMVMLVIGRLPQRTLIPRILTAGRDASIPRSLRSHVHGAAPLHQPPRWREARDPPP